MKKATKTGVSTPKTTKVATVDKATVTVEQTAAVVPTPAAEEKAKPGRPVNPESARQKQIAEQNEKRAKGEIKRGRPIVEGSAHQIKLAEQAKRKEENGGVARRGRPVDPNSPRQLRLAEQAERRAKNGGVTVLGRPKEEKPAAEATEVVIVQK